MSKHTREAFVASQPPWDDWSVTKSDCVISPTVRWNSQALHMLADLDNDAKQLLSEARSMRSMIRDACRLIDFPEDDGNLNRGVIENIHSVTCLGGKADEIEATLNGIRCRLGKVDDILHGLHDMSAPMPSPEVSKTISVHPAGVEPAIVGS